MWTRTGITRNLNSELLLSTGDVCIHFECCVSAENTQLWQVHVHTPIKKITHFFNQMRAEMYQSYDMSTEMCEGVCMPTCQEGIMGGDHRSEWGFVRLCWWADYRRQ